MSLLHEIRNASIDEVEAVGLVFRVRRICSADLAKVGFAALAMATPEAADDGFDADAALQQATVAAGVMAVGDQNGNWDDLKLTIHKEKEAPDNGVLWVGSLPPGASEVLFSRIMELSTDQEEAAKRLAGFCGTTGDASRGDRARSDVRKVAP